MFLGILVLVSFGAYRAVTSEGWDDSNVFNWLRLFVFVCIHPGKFSGLYRLSDEELDLLNDNGFDPLEPFDFIRGDEFSDNFPKTRE